MTLLFSNCLLFLMLVSRVVFLFCVLSERLFKYSVFFASSTLSRFVSVFVVLRPVLVREGFTSGMGF